MTRAAFVLALALALAPRAEAHWETTFFPAHVGNEWSYEVRTAQLPPSTVKVMVDALWVSPTTGFAWFRFRNFSGNYHWLHQTPEGRVYEWWPGGLWLRLHAAVGTTWSVNVNTASGSLPCMDGALAEVHARDELVTVPAGTFLAVHVAYESDCADLGVTDEWYAAGVGLVRRDEQTLFGPKVWSLKGARISGRTIGGSP